MLNCKCYDLDRSKNPSRSGNQVPEELRPEVGHRQRAIHHQIRNGQSQPGRAGSGKARPFQVIAKME